MDAGGAGRVIGGGDGLAAGAAPGACGAGRDTGACCRSIVRSRGVRGAAGAVCFGGVTDVFGRCCSMGARAELGAKRDVGGDGERPGLAVSDGACSGVDVD